MKKNNKIKKNSKAINYNCLTIIFYKNINN